ncbi:esterase-like activity of phytase family protein [Sphingomonas sp. ASV193]|uniref:esterase-like activity of phytase family protein n=1 Tax=Sphingomonas sp. ASV193 TaxID=3144405 RepID=UPI0032E880B8
MQLSFSKSSFFNGLALIGLIGLMAVSDRGANRFDPVGDRSLALDYRARPGVAVEGPARLVGAWEVRARDPRFGGLSALAVERGRLLAVSDSAVAMWLDPPGGAAPVVQLHSIAETAGDPARKIGRDSEGLAPDPLGRGWWLSYEQVHSLILYDRRFDRALARIALSSPDFEPNLGVEAIWPDGTKIDWIAEASGVSDAARLPDGRVAMIHRGIGPTGFHSWISGLGAPIRLRLGPLDNPEGIAAAPLPGGGTRLWIVTDNDFIRWRPTLLVAIDLPPKG